MRKQQSNKSAAAKLQVLKEAWDTVRNAYRAGYLSVDQFSTLADSLYEALKSA